MGAAATTRLWMIEDLEPWPDAPAVGQVCEPTTYWASPDTMELPAELMCTIPARIERIESGDHAERIADLGHGFTTMLPPDVVVTDGEENLTGFLVWDRYLWLDYRNQPTGQALVTERVPLIQRAETTVPAHPGVHSVAYLGPKTMCRGIIPDGFHVVAYALSVTLL
ncbi:hypothetical protein [Prescottella agglutinans]|uniref:Uncharacterized protein n=1 Tax=Prescottella agglutinans TaxID=1644129 RepID=A0ABT6MBS6_9NOCA|nr:hypothetical protein [Prescottella agglutinans]MDH6281760.1 hypothetical protein [Prescottella agglutinans]